MFAGVGCWLWRVRGLLSFWCANSCRACGGVQSFSAQTKIEQKI